MRRLWIVGALLAVLFLAPAVPVLADDGDPPQVYFGRDFTLESGERVDGDLIVFGGNVELEAESEVDGQVVAWGGDVEIAGTADGDVVVFGGDIYLAESAVVEGDLAVFGGEVEREEGAVVYGQQTVNPGNWEWDGPVVRPFPAVGRRGFSGPVFYSHPGIGAVLAVLRVIGVVIVMAGLAGVISLLWPRPVSRTGGVALQSPWPAFGVGLLTAVVVAALLASFCLTPLGIIALIVAGVAAVFGWISLGVLVGERLFAGRAAHPFWVAVLGTALLTFLGGLLDLIPCVGWIGAFLVICLGLGAAILTRLGTVDYPGPSPASPAPPPVIADEQPPLLADVVEVEIELEDVAAGEEEPVEE